MNKNIKRDHASNDDKHNNNPEMDLVSNDPSATISNIKNDLSKKTTGNYAKEKRDTPPENQPSGWEKRHSRISLWVQGGLTILNIITLVAFIFSVWYQGYLTREALDKSDTSNFYTSESLKLTKKADSIAEQALVHSIISDSESGILAIKDTLARERNTKKELRAYIAIKDITMSYIGNDSISWTVGVINSGKTPAYKVVGYGVFKKGGTGIYDSEIVKMMKESTSAPSRMSGNGIDFTMEFILGRKSIKIDSTYISNLFKGDVTIYFYGCVVYYDVFGNKHKTRFCCFTEPISDTSLSVNIYKKYNDGD